MESEEYNEKEIILTNIRALVNGYTATLLYKLNDVTTDDRITEFAIEVIDEKLHLDNCGIKFVVDKNNKFDIIMNSYYFRKLCSDDIDEELGFSVNLLTSELWVLCGSFKLVAGKWYFCKRLYTAAMLHNETDLGDIPTIDINICDIEEEYILLEYKHGQGEVTDVV